MQLITDFANSKVVIIDNYDSFTYNLVHQIEKIVNTNVTVFLNDAFDLEQLDAFDKVVLSPGPGLPQNAGKLMQVIDVYKNKKSMLGVCLGHQAIGLYFGANLINLNTVYHGIQSPITFSNFESNNVQSIFKNIEQPMQVGRYHSWVINPLNLPNELIITAKDSEGNIMAIEHKNFNITGVQFHPESIMTPDGLIMMKNWISRS